MKLLRTTILVLVLIAGCRNISTPCLISSASQLKEAVGSRILMSGTYHDPGKGSAYVDCGFVLLHIQDYSFKTRTADGYLLPKIHDGEVIQFEATLCYFAGSKLRADEGPVVQEAAPPPVEIDGEKWIVYPPQYSIKDATHYCPVKNWPITRSAL